MQRRRVIGGRAAIAALLLLVAGLHAPGLDSGFLSDDFMILGHLHRAGVAHGFTHAFLDLSGVLFYRPLLTASYALDQLVWGLDPWGFHLTNLLLHLVVTLLVYQVGRQLTGRFLVGLAAAAWIGLQPMNPNTVTWVAGRVSLLGVLFPLLATAAFLAARARGGRAAGATALVALALGLLSKESAVVVPLFLLLADWILPGRRAARTLHLGLWGVLGAYFVVRYLVLGTFLGGYGAVDPGVAVSPGARAFAALRDLAASLLDAVADPGLQPIALRWIVLGIVLAALVVWLLRRAPRGRAALVALVWAGAMTALLYPAWELAAANAERWYPALVGGSLFLGIVLAGCGRLGALLAVALIAAGLPLLGAREQAFRDAGRRARALIAQVSAEPENGHPLFVYGVPLTLGPAPFLHFGLADALAPPFRAARREVFVVHQPLTDGPATTVGPQDGTGGKAATHRDWNPAAWLIARQGPITVLRCDPAGVLRERVDRAFLLAYEGFQVTRRAEPLGLTVRPARWHRGAAFHLSVEAAVPFGDIRIELFTAAGGLRLGPLPSLQRDLAPLVIDHLAYPGCRRGYVVVTARETGTGRIRIGGAWVPVDTAAR